MGEKWKRESFKDISSKEEKKMEFEYKMVIVTREDLKLSPGKLAAQVAHAAVACALETKKINSKWFTKWQNQGAKKAVVKVENEKDFYFLKEKAKKLASRLIELIKTNKDILFSF
jgi:peptidyl-tRNA hydrolase